MTQKKPMVSVRTQKSSAIQRFRFPKGELHSLAPIIADTAAKSKGSGTRISGKKKWTNLSKDEIAGKREKGESAERWKKKTFPKIFYHKLFRYIKFNWNYKGNIIVKLYKTKFWTNVLLYKSEKISRKVRIW